MKSVLIPDLNNSLEKYFLVERDITTIFLNSPEKFPDEFVTGKSVFDLLFNNYYSYDEYIYTFSPFDYSSFPSNIINRINSSINRPDVYVTDISGENIFNFTEEEIGMFDKLLEYRNLQLNDLSGIDYSGMVSDLSKLIFIYLDIIRFKNHERINNLIDFQISEERNKLLNRLYYNYVMDEVHKYVRMGSILLNSEDIFTYYYKVKFRVMEDTTGEEINISISNVPEPLGQIYISINSELIPESFFQSNYNSNKLELDVGKSFKKDDIILIEYYTTDSSVEEPEIDSLFVIHLKHLLI